MLTSETAETTSTVINESTDETLLKKDLTETCYNRGTKEYTSIENVINMSTVINKQIKELIKMHDIIDPKMSDPKITLESLTNILLLKNQLITGLVTLQKIMDIEMNNLREQKCQQIKHYNYILNKKKEEIKVFHKCILNDSEELYKNNKMTEKEFLEYKNKYTTTKFFNFYQIRFIDITKILYDTIQKILSMRIDESNIDKTDKINYTYRVILLRNNQIDELIKLHKTREREMLILNQQIRDIQNKFNYVMTNRKKEKYELLKLHVNIRNEVNKLREYKQQRQLDNVMNINV
jgi:hypothetical protein